ncbi:alpha/beta hydrolase family protein [Shewanella waksmanii]|uniref:alpha/beta hydrolase family protein n=1 Tax=Shewanella waksmanii TaxID=213783 RepID=UPI0004910F4E|nr:S9 family peptidase [Shewanella waksmanii]
MKLIMWFSFVIWCFFSTNSNASETELVEQFSRASEFSQIKISPTGKYLSAIVPKDGKDALLILDAKTKKPTNVVHFESNAQVGTYEWVNEERVVLAKTYLKGWSDHPLYYGELMAVNADGSRQAYLFGYKGGQQVGSRIKRNTAISATAYIFDPLPENDKYMLVKALPWGNGSSNTSENKQQIYRVDVYKGTRKKIATAPIPYAQFLTDHDGKVRFVSGTNDYVNSQLFYRKDGKWVDTKNLNLDLKEIRPLAFNSDNTGVYILGSEAGKTQGVFLLDINTGTKKLVSRDEVVDPNNIWIDRISKNLYAIEYQNGYPTYEFIDKNDEHSIILKQLLKALPGHQVHLVSQTNDASQLVIKAFNDRNPGDYYVFHSKKKQLEYLVSAKKWLDPELMAEMKPISFTARDGKTIHGYLTLPHGVDPKNLPLVVNPHGGPHGPRDWWGFDSQNQMIASKGAAVLQVNFRGSGGYGLDFEHAGHQKWGTDIQYDIIDATRYVIDQGYVDKDRVCIVGGSFGGYSALQSPIIEPDMFKCAIGFAGVYDLELMFNKGDVPGRRAGKRYLNKVLGKDEKVLQQMSPSHNTDKLKTNLLLVHGGEDERAPIEQLEALEADLKKHNYPYEKLVMDDEGHGFYSDAHRAKYYQQMLSFLQENLRL